MKIQTLDSKAYVGASLRVQVEELSPCVVSLSVGSKSYGVESVSNEGTGILKVSLGKGPIYIVHIEGKDTAGRVCDESNLLWLGISDPPERLEIRPVPVPWMDLLRKMIQEVPEGEMFPVQESQYFLPFSLWGIPFEVLTPNLQDPVELPSGKKYHPQGWGIVTNPIAFPKGLAGLTVVQGREKDGVSVYSSTWVGILYALAQVLWEEKQKLPDMRTLWSNLLGYGKGLGWSPSLDFILREEFIKGVADTNATQVSRKDEITSILEGPVSASNLEREVSVSKIPSPQVTAYGDESLVVNWSFFSPRFDMGWSYLDYLNAGGWGGGLFGANPPFSGWSPVTFDESGVWDEDMPAGPSWWTETFPEWDLQGKGIAITVGSSTYHLSFDSNGVTPNELADTFNRTGAPIIASPFRHGVFFTVYGGSVTLSGTALEVLGWTSPFSISKTYSVPEYPTSDVFIEEW